MNNDLITVYNKWISNKVTKELSYCIKEAMIEYSNLRQADVISSGTKPKCDKCADMYWIYEDNGTRRGCECHYL